MAWFMLLLQQCQLALLHHHAPCTVQHDGLFCVTQCSITSKSKLTIRTAHIKCFVVKTKRKHQVFSFVTFESEN